MRSRPGQGWGWRARAPHLGHRVPPGGAAQRHRPAGLRGACADRLLRVELDVLGDADRLAEAGPRAVGEGPPWYPRSGPAGFGRGRARQAPPLSTLTGAANGRLRPASWPPVDMVLATGAWSSTWDSVAISLPARGMGGPGQRAAEGTAGRGSPGSATRVVTGREQLATFKAGKEALRTPEVPHDRPNRGVFSWSGSPWRMCIHSRVWCRPRRSLLLLARECPPPGHCCTPGRRPGP